jgi:arabinofuranosyltransferase
VPLAVALSYALALPVRFVDDAWISFRYAANVADGVGPVFNQGERVEAISNPLWTAFLAVAYKLHLPLPLTAWVTGVACVLAVVWMTTSLVRRITGSELIGVVSGTALALTTHFMRSSLNGLETCLYTALLLAALSCLLSENRRARVGFGLAVTGLALTRFEGHLLAVILLAGLFVLRRDGTRETLRRNIVTAAGVVAVLFGVELARIAYYSELVPMSVIAKRDVGRSLKLQVGSMIRPFATYMVQTFGRGGLVLLATTAVVVLVALVARRKRLPVLYLALCGAVVAFGLAVTVENKGDWMPAARLLTPYFPVLLVLVASTFWAMFRSRRRQATVALVVWALAWLVLLPGTWSFNRDRAPKGYGFAAAFRQGAFTNDADDFGRVLRRVYEPGDVFATAAIGQMGYYGRPAPMFDMLGLAEPAIARSPGKGASGGKYNLSYTAQQRPSVIVDVTPVTVVATAALAPDRYCGLLSPALTNQLLFVAVRCDLNDRIATPLTARFGGRSVGIKRAERIWLSRHRFADRFRS